MKLQNSIPVLLLVAIVFASCSSKSEEVSTKPRYVKTHKVSTASNNHSTVYNGVVSENREVQLAFKVPGPVNKLNVSEGDFVKQGQILASIDKRDYKINLQTAEAQYNQVKSEYERYNQLFEQDKLPANTLEKVKAGYLMAKSQYESAQNALIDTDLIAPFSGYVSAKTIENFATVGAGQSIIHLIDVSELEVVISIPESQINDIEKVNNITCDIKNAKRFNVPANVKSISKKSGADRMFEVRLVLNDADLSIVKSGMVAKVTVNYTIAEQGNITVPIEAVFANGTKSYVWYINNKNMKVSKKEVVIGDLVGAGFITIKNGVTVNDVIVTAGVYSLQENQEVKIMPNKSESNVGGLL